MSDTITIVLLDDGSVKVETEGVSASNHLNAEELLTLLEKGLGSRGKRSKRKHKHGHVHVHEHVKQRG